MKVIIRLLLFSLVLLAWGCDHFNVTRVDMIIHNAVIYQVDDAFSKAEAMAIHQGKIVAIGSEREIMNSYDSDEIVDAGKKAIFPGLIDAHAHFLAFGLLLQDAELVDTKSWKECLQIMQTHAQNQPNGWLIGRGWDQNDWQEKELPTKVELDELFPDRPVWLTRIDGHAGIANQRALEIAGIEASDKVTGGQIVVKNNQCTGVLVDNAMNKLLKVIPPRTENERIKALLDAQSIAWKMGLTAISEAGLEWRDIQLIKKVYGNKSLELFLDMWASDTEENRINILSTGVDTSNANYQIQGFKFYADGALGSRGACLLNPYADLLAQGTKSYGSMIQLKELLAERFWALKEKGFQVCTHAIGDSANRVVLQLYASMLGGNNDLRWRIEHAQVIDPSDLTLFGQYNIIPSVQPTHATSDAPWAWERLGQSRIRNAYRYKSLLDQNGMLPLGTDFPIENINPLNTFYSAVFRKSRSDKSQQSFQIEESLSREQAIRGMTIWPAIAMRKEKVIGSLEVGKLANFVIIDIDIMEASDEQCRKAEVLSTYYRGKSKFSAL